LQPDDLIVDHPKGPVGRVHEPKAEGLVALMDRVALRPRNGLDAEDGQPAVPEPERSELRPVGRLCVGDRLKPVQQAIGQGKGLLQDVVLNPTGPHVHLCDDVMASDHEGPSAIVVDGQSRPDFPDRLEAGCDLRPPISRRDASEPNDARPAMRVDVYEPGRTDALERVQEEDDLTGRSLRSECPAVSSWKGVAHEQPSVCGVEDEHLDLVPPRHLVHDD
jgi:hypothetical protein